MMWWAATGSVGDDEARTNSGEEDASVLGVEGDEESLADDDSGLDGSRLGTLFELYRATLGEDPFEGCEEVEVAERL